MTTNIVYFVLLNLYLNVNLINSATFENVDIILTRRQEIYSGADIDIRDPSWLPPKKTILIKSDDNLSKYVKDEIELKVIDILNQTLPKLTTNSISDLPITEEIRINWCGLKEIEPGTFNNVPKLTTIDLNNNELETIKDNVFTGLNITVLTMENNKITTIENHAFNNMQLKYLHIYFNRLIRWNSDWFNGSPINSFFIGHNQIEELPENSFNFVQPIDKKRNKKRDIIPYPDREEQRRFYIDFSFNKIKKISNGAFNKLESIESLNLKNNELETLQSHLFYGIKYLGGLHLDNNKISNVDEDIFENDARIISMGLENNKLSSFPLKLLKTNINYLRINDNPLQCDWIKSAEEWMSNKTGDYFQPSFSPAIFNLDEIKKTCVN